MNVNRSFAVAALTLILALFVVGEARAGISRELHDRLSSAAPDEEIPVIVSFDDSVNPDAFKYDFRARRITKMINALKKRAGESQGKVARILSDKQARRVRQLWLSNKVAFRAKPEVVRLIANQVGVNRVTEDVIVHAPETVVSATGTGQWNLDAMNCGSLWGEGFKGQGIVVATMDTGVDADHAALKDNWRGGANSWFDVHGSHVSPFDANGHGTQVMSLICGTSITGMAVGVAPEAEWIAVKIFDDSGAARLSDIHLGFQWLLDPDRDPETDDAPHVVNNSWGLAGSTNVCLEEFREDIRALLAAGIAVVFSAGNEGPAPFTSVCPASYEESCSVGAIGSTRDIYRLSSRGPAACSGAMYPVLCAPGENVFAADLTMRGVFPNSSTYVEGSSFSSAHVAGGIALLLSAVQDLQPQEVVERIKESSLDLGAAGPDNDYGYGLPDLGKAYQLLLGPGACVDADRDGYFADGACGSRLDCNDADASIHPDAVEIKHDGLDQDCNGYDLTITVVRTMYLKLSDTLIVEAASALGQDARLELVGYGPMRYQRQTGRWIISVRSSGGNPGSVTVRGVEGEETALIKLIR